MQALLEQIEQRTQAAAQAAAAAVGSYLTSQIPRTAQLPSWDKLVPVFDSKKKDYTAVEWLCKAEDAFHLSMPDINVSSKNRILHVSTKLKGKEASWFNSRRSEFLPSYTAESGDENLASWEDFKQEFVNEYEVDEITRELDILNDSQAPSEPLSAYFSRFRSQCQQLYGVDENSWPRHITLHFMQNVYDNSVRIFIQQQRIVQAGLGFCALVKMGIDLEKAEKVQLQSIRPTHNSYAEVSRQF